jgi:hypothetical protein
MTEDYLTQAKIVQKNIQDIDDVLCSIKRIEINGNNRKHKPYLKFFNMLKRKNGKDVLEATVLLFDGVGMYGTEVPVDDRLLNCLKEHYQERLMEAKAILDAM